LLYNLSYSKDKDKWNQLVIPKMYFANNCIHPLCSAAVISVSALKPNTPLVCQVEVIDEKGPGSEHVTSSTMSSGEMFCLIC
jgi:hypothetical protein